MFKRQFILALFAAGTTQKQWAKANGVHQTLVSNILTGRLKSAKAERLMRDFIAEQLPKLARELSEAA
jgi:O-methyltransferase involved in polyketide biosynthesis